MPPILAHESDETCPRHNQTVLSLVRSCPRGEVPGQHSAPPHFDAGSLPEEHALGSHGLSVAACVSALRTSAREQPSSSFHLSTPLTLYPVITLAAGDG